jgi:GNAT superfamily N-acetyltransferase
MIRTLRGKEVRAASDLADTVYQPELWESFDAFERKCRLYPAGALGEFEGERLVGYVISHPWITASVVPINVELESLPPDPDCYYVHDCLVAPDRQRRGIGRRLADAAIAAGRAGGFTTFLLVSVNRTEGFWAKLGFESRDEIEYAPRTMAHKMILRVKDPR